MRHFQPQQCGGDSSSLENTFRKRNYDSRCMDRLDSDVIAARWMVRSLCDLYEPRWNMNQGGALVWRECYVQKLWQEENDLFARLAALRRVSREHRSDNSVDTIAILIKM